MVMITSRGRLVLTFNSRTSISFQHNIFAELTQHSLCCGAGWYPARRLAIAALRVPIQAPAGRLQSADLQSAGRDRPMFKGHEYVPGGVSTIGPAWFFLTDPPRRYFIRGRHFFHSPVRPTTKAHP